MIAELRAELAELLAELGGSVKVHPFVPEQVNPPCVVIQPGDPFLTDDTDDLTFSEPYVCTFELYLLVPLDDEQDNERATEQLDQLLDQLLDVLRPSSFWLAGMGQPGALMTTDWIEHGQRVTVRTRVRA